MLVVTTSAGRQRRSFQFLQSLLLQRGVHVFDYAAKPNHSSSLAWSTFSPDAILQGIEIARRTGCADIIALGGPPVLKLGACVAAVAGCREVTTRAEVEQLGGKMEAPSGVFRAAKKMAAGRPMALQMVATTPMFADVFAPCVLFSPQASELLRFEMMEGSAVVEIDADMIAQEEISEMESHAEMFQMLQCAVEAYEFQGFRHGSASEEVLERAVELVDGVAAGGKSTDKLMKNRMIQLSIELAQVRRAQLNSADEPLPIYGFNRAFSLAVASASGLDVDAIGALLLPQLAGKWEEVAHNLGRLRDSDVLGPDPAQRLQELREAMRLPSVASALEMDSEEGFDEWEEGLAKHAFNIATADHTRKVGGGLNVESFRTIL